MHGNLDSEEFVTEFRVDIPNLVHQNSRGTRHIATAFHEGV